MGLCSKQKDKPEKFRAGHFTGAVHNRGACPYCSEQRVLPGKNSLYVCFPDLAQYWSPNNERSADTVLPKSGCQAKWICPDCHGEFTAAITNMVSGEADCPYCNDRQVLPGFNSLVDRHPDIAKLWSPNNERPATNVFPGSKSQAKWVCPECHGEYSALIADMVFGEANCPYCNDRYALPGFNSLADRYPEIEEPWSSNNERPATSVLPGSKSQAKWICPECHGEFSALIADMVRREVTCPYCNDRQVLPGFNSFAVRHEKLLQEWDMVNNYLIADHDQIGDRCQTPVWWVCAKDPTHEYMIPPARKLLFQKRHRESCPYCKGLRRINVTLYKKIRLQFNSELQSYFVRFQENGCFQNSGFHGDFVRFSKTDRKNFSGFP